MKKFYMLFCLLLASGFVVGLKAAAWDGSASTWTKGDGSASNPFLIENEQHFAFLGEKVRGGEPYAGKHFKLMADLNMGFKEGKKLLPIGYFDEYQDTNPQSPGTIDKSKYFEGIFDGNFHTIDNMHLFFINDPDSPSGSVGGTGLFACIKGQAVIKNLSIGEESKIEGGDLVGAFVGVIRPGGRIENCCNEALVTGGAFVAGIVGESTGGIIASSCNMGIIKARGAEVGGIAGQVNKGTSINNCYNTGSVSTDPGQGAGGIAGALYGGTASNCYNIGSVHSNSGFLGKPHAISGDVDPKALISNCYYEPTLSTKPDPKGIEKTEAELKDPEFLKLIMDPGSSDAFFVADKENINNGFPILSWQLQKPTNIRSIKGLPEARAYATGKTLFVNFGKKADSGKVILSDLSGRVLQERKLRSGATLPLPEKGIYLVTLRAKGGEYSSKVLVD